MPPKPRGALTQPQRRLIIVGPGFLRESGLKQKRQIPQDRLVRACAPIVDHVDDAAVRPESPGSAAGEVAADAGSTLLPGDGPKVK